MCISDDRFYQHTVQHVIQKLSLFLIKTSNNSNATRHQKLSIYYFDKKLVVPVEKSANEFTNLK